MKWFNRHWYNVGLVVAILTGIYLAFTWSDLTILTRLMALNFIAILLHQFEELGWPGGFPLQMNDIMWKSEFPDRYPLNQFSNMLGNVVASYIFYLLPVFFSDVIWLGLAPTLFGLGQLFVHGIVNNIKMRSLYNPGLFAVVCMHVPIGVYYINYINTNNLVTSTTWLFGLLYLAVFMVAFGLSLYKLLADKNSKWAFTEDEMNRFDMVRKVKKLKSQDN